MGGAVTGPLRASPTIYFRGRELRRRAGFVIGTTLTCPLSHTFKPSLRKEGQLRCSHQIEDLRLRTICNAIMYILIFPSLGQTQRMLWVADVDVKDLEILDRHAHAPYDILAYFGAGFTQHLEQTA